MKYMLLLNNDRRDWDVWRGFSAERSAGCA